MKKARGRWVVKNGQGRPRAVVETVELTRRRFDDVDAAFACDEGRRSPYFGGERARNISRGEASFRRAWRSIASGSGLSKFLIRVDGSLSTPYLCLAITTAPSRAPKGATRRSGRPMAGAAAQGCPRRACASCRENHAIRVEVSGQTLRERLIPISVD